MTKELKKVTWISNKEAASKAVKAAVICLMAAGGLYLVDLAVLAVMKALAGM